MLNLAVPKFLDSNPIAGMKRKGDRTTNTDRRRRPACTCCAVETDAIRLLHRLDTRATWMR